jgi:hypothetical protein
MDTFTAKSPRVTYESKRDGRQTRRKVPCKHILSENEVQKKLSSVLSFCTNKRCYSVVTAVLQL